MDGATAATCVEYSGMGSDILGEGSSAGSSSATSSNDNSSARGQGDPLGNTGGASTSNSGTIRGISKGRGASFVLEGLEVDWFTPSALSTSAAPAVLGIWLFRSPLDVERKLLLSGQRQEAAAASSAALGVDEAMRMARRDEREAQLQELLSWMAAYQQQWTAAMEHVQGAIARQQKRLANIRSKQGGDQEQPAQPEHTNIKGNSQQAEGEAGEHKA